MAPGASSLAISATWAVGSTNTMPMLDTAASNDAAGSPVSDASAVTQFTVAPPAFCAPRASNSGVMSTPVTRAPRAAADRAALPVPQARSTSLMSRSGRRCSAASRTSSEMFAMRWATAS